MKQITFRKVFRYDPTFKGKYSKYEGYHLIGLQQLDPAIEKTDFQIENKFDIVFHSTLKRAKQSAQLYKADCIRDCSLVNEVAFDLKDLLKVEEYKKYGSSLVRQRFVEAFVNDELEEKRKMLEQRINNLLSLFNKLSFGKYLLISHSFFMKILEIFLKDRTLFSCPDIILKHFRVDRKTYDFGSGFDFDLL